MVAVGVVGVAHMKNIVGGAFAGGALAANGTARETYYSRLKPLPQKKKGQERDSWLEPFPQRRDRKKESRLQPLLQKRDRERASGFPSRRRQMFWVRHV
jgi:hypothetical protein